MPLVTNHSGRIHPGADSWLVRLKSGQEIPLDGRSELEALDVMYVHDQYVQIGPSSVGGMAQMTKCIHQKLTSGLSSGLNFSVYTPNTLVLILTERYWEVKSGLRVK